MTLAAGPIGLLAGAATRDVRAQCVKCGKVFARSVYSYKVEEKIGKLRAQGEVVLRSYTPPPIPPYDPQESHVTRTGTPRRSSADKAMVERVGKAFWLGVIAFFFWSAVIVELRQFRLDFANVLTEAILFAIAALSTWGVVRQAIPAKQTSTSD